MTERLSDERLACLQSKAANAAATYAIDYDEDIAEVLDELIHRRAADQWQDAPSGDGEYHVEGERVVCYVIGDVVFVPTWDRENERAKIVEKPLNGRRVCPIWRPV